MKIGFNSSICPDWDLATLVERAKAIGYDSLELCAPRGRQASAAWSALADPAGVKNLLEGSGIELTCLSTEFSLHWPHPRTVEEHQKGLRQVVEAAGSLGCRYVTMKTGSIPARSSRDRVLLRIAGALREVATEAAAHRVAILVENDANLASSRDMWFILDAAGNPPAGCCWNPAAAMAVGDVSGTAVPRIGRKVRVSHLSDAIFSSDRRPEQAVLLGHGQVDLSRYLVLMAGIASKTRLIVSGPTAANGDHGQEVLSASLAWIKSQLDTIAKKPELSAYKGDKNAPRFAARSA